MTYAGARGETETQMSRVLHFSPDQPPTHAAFGELQRQLNDVQSRTGIQLDIANALWAQKGEPFRPAFLKIAQDDYQATVKQADFQTSADAVTREINRWVAQKTKDKIQNILSPGSVNDLTRLILANAIYFKGAWASRFDQAATSPQPFHLAGNDQTDVPLMHRVAKAGYVENNDLQAVELPYRGNGLSMVILLPSQIGALDRLEQQLSPVFLAGLLAQMNPQQVEVFLPKFKLESGFTLNDTLSQMGMPDAFLLDKADFSGLYGTGFHGRLNISGVFHKAWVEVNEEGTEAAAATVVTLAAHAVVKTEPPPVFRADHPFVFLIRDTRSGSLMFVGRLADPRGS
jgi:serpin B